MNFKKHNSKAHTYFWSSERLGINVPLQIIDPRKSVAGKEIRPVLYLLHGLFGRFDNWTTLTEIYGFAKDCEFCIVCVEGGNGWYSDSPLLKNHFYESYILEELIPAVESQFNFGQSRSRRAVAGLSMGGYGAFKLAFRRPEMFCFATSMSGAFHAAEVETKSQLWKELQPSIQAVFGEDFLIRKENDLFQIIENFPKERFSHLPDLYFDCGSEDAFLPINQKLAAKLERRSITHEFRIIPGGHDWIYWNQQLAEILRRTSKIFFDTQ